MPRLILLVLLLALIPGGTRAADPPPTVEEERAALRLADPNLTIEPVATEPNVVSPVAMAWDGSGRLYVAEMSDYPNAATGGRIRLLEDRDADDRYEHATVFARGLPFPNGVLPWKGGLLVTAAPDLIFFEDTDNDGRADKRRVILTGFGEGNQQLRVNSPAWGLDGRLYLANGRSGGAVRRPEDAADKAVPIPQNDLRFDPKTGAVEAIAGFSQFGLAWDDWGDRFPSWNTTPVRHVVREVSASASPTVADILDLSDGGRVYSIAPSARRFNAESVSFFNATCGPTIERGALGDAYRGDVFFCEPLSSVVIHRKLEPAGPTYVARRAERGREFLASAHPWFRPVNLASGPDGAIYLADFCRAWVEHPAFVPEALRNTVDFREGHQHGRLWRIAPKGLAHRVEPWPAHADTKALVAILADPIGWRRDTARRLLIERRPPEAVGLLRSSVRESKDPRAVVQALWTLHGLDSLDPDSVRTALRSPAPRVREHGCRLADKDPHRRLPELAACADDPEPRVRMRAALALGRVDDDLARDALASIASRDAEDPWITSALLEGLTDRPKAFLDALATKHPDWLSSPTRNQASFLRRLASLASRETDRRSFLDRIAANPRTIASFALVAGLSSGESRPPARDDGAARSADFTATAEAARAVARDTARPEWARALALDMLVTSRNDGAGDALLDCLEPNAPIELQRTAARDLGTFADPTTLETVLGRWDRYSVATRRFLIGILVGRAATATRLLDAVERGTVSADEFDPATRDALRALFDPGLKARVEALLPVPTTAARDEVLRRYAPALTLSGDSARGRLLYERNCRQCHAYNAQGPKVGPDLLSVAGRPKDDLLVAILDPGREVSPDSISVVVATTRGQTLTGVLAEETPAAIRLRRSEGIEDMIPRGEIEAMKPTGKSLMPEGLETRLTPQDVADLIAFLRTPPTED